MKTTPIFVLALILSTLVTARAQQGPLPFPHPPQGHEEDLLFDYSLPAGAFMPGRYLALQSRGLAPFMAAGTRRGGSYLGIHIVEVDDARAAELKMDSPHGVQVSNVAQGSPADESGLEKGDVVVKFDGRNVHGVEHFIRLVRETPAGRSITMSILRAGAPRVLTAQIGRRKAARGRPHFFCGEEGENCTAEWIRKKIIDMPRPRIVMRNRYLGAELEPVEGQLADYFGVEEGVLVRSVDSNTPGERAGLQAGDVIVSVNGKNVDSPAELRENIQRADPAGGVEMTVMRKGAAAKLTLEPRQRGGRRQGGVKSRTIRDNRFKRL